MSTPVRELALRSSPFMDAETQQLVSKFTDKETSFNNVIYFRTLFSYYNQPCDGYEQGNGVGALALLALM
jgi:hypothetical protein